MYVGITERLKIRINVHKSLSKKPTYYFHRALKKHGLENFVFSVICVANRKEASRIEKLLIEKLNCLVPNGYNSRTGGDNEYILSVESKEILSQKTKQQWEKNGDLLRYKIKEAMNRSDVKENILKSFTPERRKKLSESASKRKDKGDKRTNKILCVETGEIFENSKSAGRFIKPETDGKVTGGAIYWICRQGGGNRYGYTWKFVNSDVPVIKRKRYVKE